MSDGLFGLLSAFASALIVPGDQADTADRVRAALAGFGIAIVLGLVVIWVGTLFWIPYRQRNDLLAFWSEHQRTAHPPPRMRFTEASRPQNGGVMVFVQVKNCGPTATFHAQGIDLNGEPQLPWPIPWSEDAVDVVLIPTGLENTLRLGVVDWLTTGQIAITPFKTGVGKTFVGSTQITQHRQGNRAEFDGDVAEIRLVVRSDADDTASYDVTVKVWHEEGSPRMKVMSTFIEWPGADPQPMTDTYDCNLS